MTYHFVGFFVGAVNLTDVTGRNQGESLNRQKLSVAAPEAILPADPGDRSCPLVDAIRHAADLPSEYGFLDGFL